MHEQVPGVGIDQPLSPVDDPFLAGAADSLGEQGRTGTLVGTVSGPGPAGVLLGGEAAAGWTKASPLASFSTRRY
ncbi:hypothetical protein [Amycolatopsis sp. lyj-23]|uniref:hypothetical protein n=1 Tax=Amycolatopsis sp. lyj-23 TaxID=2789283 RepID=UPI0039789CC9